MSNQEKTARNTPGSAEECPPLTVTTFTYVKVGDLTVERIYQRYPLPPGTRTWAEIAQERLGSGTRVHRATLSNHLGDVLEHFSFPPASKEGEPDSHDWDDQDKCSRCGDRDWYASATCTPKQQPADEPYEVLFTAAMKTAEQAMDYVQNNPDKFDARPGDDKLAIVCREFLKAQQPAEQKPVCPTCYGLGWGKEYPNEFRLVTCPDCAGSGEAEHSITVQEVDTATPNVARLVGALEQVIKAAPDRGPLWHGSEQINEARAALAAHRKQGGEL